MLSATYRGVLTTPHYLLAATTTMARSDCGTLGLVGFDSNRYLFIVAFRSILPFPFKVCISAQRYPFT
jgi:hypothetical protein